MRDMLDSASAFAHQRARVHDVLVHDVLVHDVLEQLAQRRA